MAIIALVLALPGCILVFWQLWWGRRENGRRDEEIRILKEQSAAQGRADVTAWLANSPHISQTSVTVPGQPPTLGPKSVVREFEVACSGPAAASNVAVWLAAVVNPDEAPMVWRGEQGLGTLRPADAARKVTFRDDDLSGELLPCWGFLVGRWTDGTGEHEERLVEVDLYA